VKAKIACPIACKSKECKRPQCSNLNWKPNKNFFLECDDLKKKSNKEKLKKFCGEVGKIENDLMFAYEACKKCKSCKAKIKRHLPVELKLTYQSKMEYNTG